MAQGRPTTLSSEELRQALEKYHEAAYGWCLHCCDRNRDEAEDVLHTVYVKVLEGRARFNGRSSFRTWLFSIIRNTAVDFGRSWLRRLRLEDRWRSERRPRGNGGDPPREVWIEGALEELSARQREVVHLTFYQGLTLEEASEVMRVSIGSARTHYQRGKAKLRELLSAPGESAIDG